MNRKAFLRNTCYLSLLLNIGCVTMNEKIHVIYPAQVMYHDYEDERAYFDYYMFTSYGERLDKNGIYQKVFHGDDLNKITSLRLTKNLYKTPSFFNTQLYYGFIISESLKDELKYFYDMSFKKIEFKKIFYHPYEIGPPPIKKLHSISFVEEYIASLADVKQNFPNLVYFEIFCPDVMKQNDVIWCELDFFNNCKLSKNVGKKMYVKDVIISKDLISQSPVYQSSSGALVMRDDFFQVLKKHINWKYFAYSSFNPNDSLKLSDPMDGFED